jgi:hypothetical protein
MKIESVHLLLTSVFGMASLIIIPKKCYKKFFLYGLIFGGLMDSLVVIVLSLLKLIQFRNMGYLNFQNLFPIVNPLTWIFVFMLFFYFLPVSKSFFYLYILGFTLSGMLIGSLLSNLNLFEDHIPYCHPLFFLLEFFFAAWVYRRREEITSCNIV